jgi:hypothetical protein
MQVREQEESLLEGDEFLHIFRAMRLNFPANAQS